MQCGRRFFSSTFCRGFANPARSIIVSKTSEFVPPVSPPVHVRGIPVQVVDTVAKARELSRLLSVPDTLVAWNIEAGDVDVKRFHSAGTGGRILCASACVNDSVFFVDNTPESEEARIFEELKEYFENSKYLKTSHSVADDYHMLAEHGIQLRGVESDTRYLARLCNTALSSWEAKAAACGFSDGYDLRSTVSFFLSMEMEFADKKIEKIIKRFNGSKIAHLSQNYRPYWIGRVAESAMITRDLHGALRAQLAAAPWTCEVWAPEASLWDMAQRIHLPLVVLLAEIEYRGISIDMPFLKSVGESAEKHILLAQTEFVQIAGSMMNPANPKERLNPDAHLINVHSVPQVRQLLFGCPSDNMKEWFSYGKKSDLKKIPNKETFGDGAEITIGGIGLRPIESKMKRKRLADFSPKGVPSVNQKLLSEYASGKALEPGQLGRFGAEFAALGCELLRALVTLGKFHYVVGSFIDPLIERVVNGRIHPSLSLDTSTGRLVCRKPNLHNPPNASDTLGVRAAFVAGPGNTLLVADYSQLELRILAHVTSCASMIASLNAGGDYHSWTALEMFPDPIQKAIDAGTCSIGTIKSQFPLLRSKAKAVNFSIAYGKCARSIAEEMDCQLAEAEDLLRTWYSTKPEVAAWKSNVVFEARVTKKVKSIIGRTRDIPHIENKLWKGRSERAAVNHCIQGSAADIAICAMLQIGSSPRLEELGYSLLMQIHDEFILEGPIEHSEEAKTILVDLMQNPFRDLNPDYRFKVNLDVDAGVGPNWLTAKP